MGTPDDTIRVGRRYNGPPASANGGYFSGLLAPRARRMLDVEGDLVVQLHAPPPLDTDLRLAPAGRRVHVWHGDVLVATAAPQAIGTDTVEAIAPDLAEQAMFRYEGHGAHPFPTCFVCGPRHPDGLRLAPGPVAGHGNHVACLWTPDASTDDGTGTGLVSEELVWAALDCPGGWTLDPLRSPLVLGRMTARITALPRVGETVVAVGRGTPGDGRVHSCTTALVRRDGTELARSTATWVRLAPTASPQDTKAAIS
ncbi:hypothetical protein OG897_14850 [Streptomyces sp. NBC_00237]|uniref:hypothetical protein n=1 Tax=Streptomyces sp. NBC_00237 TaxID=2975687 RepID=UPI002258ACC8|nr:hypothetical protein [Streptomyces sp. NBC_00237]MCX5202723.1 hypothetical protein [Streptomyces sp. NBC_00237]